jgi:hypothetical protein
MVICSEVCKSSDKALRNPSVAWRSPESVGCYHNGAEHWEDPCVVQPLGCERWVDYWWWNHISFFLFVLLANGLMHRKSFFIDQCTIWCHYVMIVTFPPFVPHSHCKFSLSYPCIKPLLVQDVALPGNRVNSSNKGRKEVQVGCWMHVYSMAAWAVGLLAW